MNIVKYMSWWSAYYINIVLDIIRDYWNETHFCLWYTDDDPYLYS